MGNGKLVLAVCSAALFALTLVPRASATIDVHKTTYLTFSQPVRLPGISLGSGTYIFEIANPETGGDVVRVMSRDRSISYFLGFTLPVTRPHSMSRDQLVSLGEAAAGTAPTVAAWWPERESTGRQFVYPRAR